MGLMKAVHPTARMRLEARWVLVLLVGIVALHLVAPSRAWIAVLVTLGGALLLGYVWVRHLSTRLTISRNQHYGWVHVGDLLEERFELRNQSFFPLLWIEIDDQSDLPGYSASSVRSADAGQVVRWRTEGVCSQRGLFTLGPWRALTSDPFGFFTLTLEHPESRSILIYPQVVYLPVLQLPPGSATGTGRISIRTQQVNTDATGVRAYAPGDSLNRVHWRSTAKCGGMMVKTFDLAPSGNLWIVIDLDREVQVGEGTESTEEYAVILASSLADRALRENRGVGLLGYGAASDSGSGSLRPLPTLVHPGSGTAHQWQILQALALIRAGGNWPLARVLAEMHPSFGRNSTVAIITSSCRADWLTGLLLPMRRGVTFAAILLDPASFGGQGDVGPLVGLLADIGVISHVVTQGIPFEPVVKHLRIGRPEYRVLRGTGRVIAVGQ